MYLMLRDSSVDVNIEATPFIFGVDAGIIFYIFISILGPREPNIHSINTTSMNFDKV